MVGLAAEMSAELSASSGTMSVPPEHVAVVDMGTD